MFGFVLPNVISIGATVAWIHDLADVLGAMVKGASKLHFEKCTIFIFINMMALWFTTRLVWLPIFIYTIVLVATTFTDDQLMHPDIRPFGGLNFVFLMALQILHIYWFWIFIKHIQKALAEGLEGGGTDNMVETERTETKVKNA